MSTAAVMNDGKVVSADHVMNASEVAQIVSPGALPSEFITTMQATDALENL